MRVIMAGGGTGGHLFPGLSLAKAMEKIDPDVEVSFVGTSHGLDMEIVPRAGYFIDILSAGRGSPLSLSHLSNFPRFILSIWQSLKLFKAYKPDVMVALGGFAAATPGIAARILGVPVVILEQNSVPGRVNRLLSRWAKGIYLQFRCARERFTNTRAKFFDLGSPMREQMCKLAEEKPVDGDALLIIGGSQGAQRLNEIVLESIKPIQEQTGCRIIHVAGAGNEEGIRKAYRDLKVEATVHGFFGKLSDCYRESKLAISRSGAGSIAELAAAGLPSILVPLPTAMDNHQQLNAEWVAAKNGAIVLEQPLLTPDILTRQVVRIWKDKQLRDSMAEAVRLLARPESASEIAESIMQLIAEKG